MNDSLQLDIPAVLLPLATPARHKIAYGGRGSAKSWTVARLLIIKAMTKKGLILCAREFQSSISDSVYRLLVSQIVELRLRSFFNITLNTIICNLTGTAFIFKGIRRNVDEIKSTEGVTDCWVEEAQSVSEDSWRVLTPTIFRNPGAELWITFNPKDETDSTYQRWVLNPPPGAIVLKSNYSENPWFSQEMEEDRLWTLKTDPDAYDWIWEGNVRALSDAIVFRNKFSIEAFEPPQEFEKVRYYYGADWGFATDPTVLVCCYIYGKNLYVIDEAYGHKVELDNLSALFDRIPGARGGPIYGDSARPETISYMRRQGFNIDAAEKWVGSVEDGIAHLLGFEKIIVHERCFHTATEMALYSYKVDRITGEVLPDIADKNNHCIDGLRYALNKFIQSRGGLGMWHKLGGN